MLTLLVTKLGHASRTYLTTSNTNYSDPRLLRCGAGWSGVADRCSILYLVGVFPAYTSTPVSSTFCGAAGSDVYRRRRGLRLASRLGWLGVARTIATPLTFDIASVSAFADFTRLRYALFGSIGSDFVPLWCVALRLRAPNIYMRFLVRELSEMSMFAHKQIIRSLVIMMTASLLEVGTEFVGITFFVCGKISVGGNSRSRHMLYYGGLRSPSRLYVEARSSRGVVWTVTGCLGVSLVIFS